MHGPNLKGGIAETKIVAAATELGIPVYTPVVEHGRADMVFLIAGRPLRVQCKWGALDEERGVVKVRLQSQRCTPNGYVRRTYSVDEIDVVAAYCGGLDRCFLLPQHLVVNRREIWLRLRPPKNGQRACTNIASEFDLAGAVAQLEERVAGSDEARGSSPLSSTSTASRTSTHAIGSHEFRNHFGYYLEEAAAGRKVSVSRHGRPFAELVPPAGEDAEPSVA